MNQGEEYLKILPVFDIHSGYTTLLFEIFSRTYGAMPEHGHKNGGYRGWIFEMYVWSLNFIPQYFMKDFFELYSL